MMNRKRQALVKSNSNGFDFNTNYSNNRERDIEDSLNLNPIVENLKFKKDKPLSRSYSSSVSASTSSFLLSSFSNTNTNELSSDDFNLNSSSSSSLNNAEKYLMDSYILNKNKDVIKEFRNAFLEKYLEKNKIGRKSKLISRQKSNKSTGHNEEDKTHTSKISRTNRIKNDNTTDRSSTCAATSQISFSNSYVERDNYLLENQQLNPNHQYDYGADFEYNQNLSTNRTLQGLAPHSFDTESSSSQISNSFTDYFSNLSFNKSAAYSYETSLGEHDIRSFTSNNSNNNNQAEMFSMSLNDYNTNHGCYNPEGYCNCFNKDKYIKINTKNCNRRNAQKVDEIIIEQSTDENLRNGLIFDNLEAFDEYPAIF